jgi:hypothetical protein
VTLSTLQLAAVLIVAGLALLAIVRFEQFCLGDLAETPDYRLCCLNRQGWVVLILLFIPLGGVLYLLYGRPR